MPRDSQGQHSLPAGTIVNSGDTLLTSQHNPALLDISQALTNSLDRGGAGGMLANLSMNNNRITGLAAGVGNNDAATVAQVNAAVGALSSVPLGTVLDYWGATPPTGYLLCYGQAVSRTTYAALFAVIGTAAGPGDGSTTFNLPDYRGLVSAGKADMGGSLATRLSDFAAAVIGSIFGTQSHTLTTAQMPVHNHGINDPGHYHPASTLIAGGIVEAGGEFVQISGTTGVATTGITIANEGAGGSHPNVQPTIICNKIMKALV